jgi:hypothetical protein
MARFKYTKRTKDQTKKRATQSGGTFDTLLKSNINTFSVKEGDRAIRILPPSWEDAEHYGYDIYVHYDVGPDSQSYLCAAKMKDKPCPICEERKAAEKDKDADPEYITALKPTKRVLTWVIDRDSEEDGPLVWSMPWTVDRDIAALSIHKKSGEVLCVDDPDEGYDIEFRRDGTGRKTKYSAMQIQRSDSPLSADEDEANDWLDFISENPLPDLLNFFEYEYIQNVFAGKKSKSDDEEEEETPRRSKRDKDDDKPRRTRIKDKEEEEEEERPRRRKKDEEEEEEERPKRTRIIDEDEEEERPSRRKRDEEEEEETPRRRKRDEDEEEERPSRRPPFRGGKKKDEDEEEEERPSRRKKDEEEEPKKGQSLRERVRASLKNRKKDDEE